MTASLEAPEGEERAAATVPVRVDGRDLAMSVPADASRGQAAAIACAVGAHLTDRQRAAAAAAAADGPESVDQWKLAGRMKGQGKRRWPENVRRGEEWKAAARSR